MKKETRKNQDILFVLLYLLTLAAFITACVFIIKETNVQIEYMKNTVTELRQQVEAANEEYRELHQQQIELIEENARLRERLERYEGLSRYIEENLERANLGITAEEIGRIVSLFWELTVKYEFDPYQIVSWIFQESEFKITAISKKGAVGLTQVLATTGQEVARKMNIEWRGWETLLDPELNLRIGFYYLNWCRERLAVVTEHQVFSAYHWGIGNLQRMGLNETAYSREIMERADQLRRMQNA